MRGWLERHGVRAILAEQRILIHCQPLMLRISMLGNHMVQRVIMIGKRAYENETSKATAGVRRRAGSVSRRRCCQAPVSQGTQRSIPSPTSSDQHRPGTDLQLRDPPTVKRKGRCATAVDIDLCST